MVIMVMSKPSGVRGRTGTGLSGPVPFFLRLSTSLFRAASASDPAVERRFYRTFPGFLLHTATMCFTMIASACVATPFHLKLHTPGVGRQPAPRERRLDHASPTR